LADYQKPGAAEAIRANYKEALRVLRNGYGWDYVDRINIGNTVFNLEWMIEGALEFIEQSKSQPFFLYVALPVPHGQYKSASCNVAKLEPRATAAGLIDKLPNVMPSRASIYERLQKAGIAPENAMATYMDDAVGAVLQKLEALGVRENTLIVFVGDNPSRGKNSVYEGAREPAFVNWPARIKAGARMTSLCANTDVAATLVEAAGGQLPADMAQDGRSFLPQLLGQPEPADWRKSLLLEIGNSKAVITERWKYIAHRVPSSVAANMQADAERAKKTGRPREIFWTGLNHHSYGAEKDFAHYYDADQLYDMQTDLYETKNQAVNPECAPKLAEMKEHLRQFMATLPHGFGEFKPVTVEAPPVRDAEKSKSKKKKNPQF
jgi:arylsulfatase A-like enzyme